METEDQKLEELLRTSRELTERLFKVQQQIDEHLSQVKGDFVPPAEDTVKVEGNSHLHDGGRS